VFSVAVATGQGSNAALPKGTMSVSLYMGLPGDGKSMSGMRKVVAHLVETDRDVVTNLPIEIGELQTYLREVYHKEIDCAARVVLLEQEQVRKFWLVRGRGWRLIDLDDDSWGKNQFPSLQKVYRWVPATGESAEREGLERKSLADVERLCERGEVEQGDLGKENLGCLYVIDECQNFWPARSYQTTPKGLLFYLSQHRHSGDDCIFITQKEAQVEKVVRNLVLEFWVFRNLGQRRRMGFKLPGMFGYACFDVPPSMQGAQYVSVGTFKMDTKGLAQCYRTADGVGVGGPSMKADTQTKRSGIPWQFAIIFLFLAGGLFYFVPGFFQGVARAWLIKPKPQGTNEVATALQVMPKPYQVGQVVTQYVVTVVSNAQMKISVPTVQATNAPRDVIVGAISGLLGYTFILKSGEIVGPEECESVSSKGGRPVFRRQRESMWITWH